MAEERPRSYLIATSPKAQYEELNLSLAAQVVDARKNLLDTFETMEPPEDDVRLNLTTIGEDFVKVFLRVRPFTPEEIQTNEDKRCIQVFNSSAIRAIAPPESNTYRNAQHLGNGKEIHEFGFSSVFSAETTQKQMFDSSALDIVKQFIEGQNSLIFSYGVTNAGKTYTIQGSESDPGIIPRALDVLFNFAKDKLLSEPYFSPKLYNDVVKCDENERKKLTQMKETIFRLSEVDVNFMELETNLTKVSSGSDLSLASSTHSLNDLSDSEKVVCGDDVQYASSSNCAGVQYLVYVSFAEIYNEYVYDLFEPPPMGGKAKRRTTLKLSEDRNGNIYVKGLTEINVVSTEEALKLLAAGQKNLRFASTRFNYNSSRRLTFCDLAGSERSAKTERAGERVKESGNINSSLLNLGRCINTLRFNQAHRDNPQIIPFRDSKLTRIFQNFLVGRGKACMIVNISQCASSFDETLHVLKFSAVVKKVKQVPAISQEPVAPHPTYSLLIRPPISKPVRSICTIPKLAPPAVIINRPSDVPLPDDEEDADDEELSTLDTTIGDNQQIQKYQVVIENLRAQLLEEKRKYLRVEQQIREEVCKEFALQMAEMEERLTEARREGIEDAEELAEERMELYIQTVKKRQNHERRLTIDPTAAADDEGDGWVPETRYKAEQLKNDEKDKEINDLKCQLQTTLTKLEEAKNAEQTTAGGGSAVSSAGNDELLSALEIKNKECQDLSDMLAEAGETFKTNATEIRRLESYVGVLEESLKKKDDEIIKIKQNNNESWKDEKTRLEARLRELEESLDALNKSKDVASSRFEQELANAKQLCEESQREVEQLKKKFSDEQPAIIAPDTPTSATANEDSDGGFKCIELESKIFELEKSLEILNVEKRNNDKNLTERREEMETLTRELWDVKRERDQLKETVEQNLKEIERISSQSKQDLDKIREELKFKTADCERLSADLVAAMQNSKALAENLEQIQNSKSADVEKLKTLESNFESLKKSLESMTHSCFEKSTSIAKLEQEKKVFDEKLASFSSELEKQEKIHLETSNQLRFELDATKVQLVETKKSKLEIAEALTTAEQKCKQLKDVATSLEQSLEVEKLNGQRIIQDSLNNEKLIETYKCAVRDQEELQKNIENALKTRTAEVEQLNSELVQLKGNFEKSENNALLIQKELNRVKNELEIKKDVENKQKSEFNAFETQIINLQTNLVAESEKLTAKNAEIIKLTSDYDLLSKRIEPLNGEISALNSKNENLTKELRTKDNFVNGLNKKIAEKEKTLNTLESEINKIEKTHQEVLAGKERQLEAWKQQKEALLVEVDKLNNDIQELKSENTSLKVQLVNKDADMDKIKLEVEASKLPPVVPTTVRRRKPPSVSVEEDEANEVEVTPMISKKVMQQHRSRAADKVVEKSDSSEVLASTSRRKTSATDQKKLMSDTGGDSSPSTTTTSETSTVPKNSKKTRVAASSTKPKGGKRVKKTVGILTEESSPIMGADALSTPYNEALSLVMPPETRPSRRAKSTAINGIFAVSEYLRNSPTAGSSTTGDGDNGDEPSLPPKKRKRTLYKSPAKAQMPTPPPQASDSASTSVAAEPPMAGKKSRKKR